MKQTRTLLHRRYRGMLAMEFICGLVLVMFLLGILLVAVGKVREADIIMANRRQAIYKAESQLAQMQIPAPRVAPGTGTAGSSEPEHLLPEGSQLQLLAKQPEDARYAWVRLTVTHDGQEASLEGLICREYVGEMQ
ncbi:hypothetical protein JYU15_00250 [bacterium AH-315-I18]|nr:hypothetical protein [Phycisphaeraceae bacterium]MBN4060843.1 hypothetical protein [bacterium AH-315-I18]